MPTFTNSTLSMWLNKFVSYLRSLEATGMDLEANTNFIVCITQKRMPNYLLARWQEEIAEENSFSTHDLLNFLEIRAKSTLSASTNDKESAITHSSGQKKYNSTTTAYATASVLNASIAPCPIDKAHHGLEECPAFQNYSPQKRKSFVVKNRLCWKCLRQKNQHNSRVCTAHCKFCPSHFKYPNHTTLLHMGPKKEMSGKTSDKDKVTESTVAITSSKDKSNVLLMTCNPWALKHESVKDGIKMRVFIDKGSQKSFITASACKKLGLPVSGKHPLSVGSFGSDQRKTYNF